MEDASAHYCAQRAQAIEALRGVRESMEQLARCLLPQEGTVKTHKPLTAKREKLIPFVREHGRN